MTLKELQIVPSSSFMPYAQTKRAARVSIVQGDLTEQDVDTIVNVANSSLMGGYGVDGAIHGHGGPQIPEECKSLRREYWPDRLPIGKAATTSGGRLLARHVIHTVGPVWRGGDLGEPRELADYTNSLILAQEENPNSVAFRLSTPVPTAIPSERRTGSP